MDLLILQENGKIITKTHFKEVDRNSYLPMNSCRHRNWLCNIPKGQLLRIKRNCTRKEDFQAQAKILEQRFINKGYEKKFITEKIQEVERMNRPTLMKDKGKDRLEFIDNIMIILDYNIQYKKVERIIKKHLHILKSDKHL